jgi:hypothetical protein
MRVKLGLIGLMLAGTLIAGLAPALAQSAACAPDDLRCRVERLEAKLASMEHAQTSLEAKQAQIPIPKPPAPFEVVDAFQVCKSSCAATADALCKSQGFIAGKVKSYDHPKIGPEVLRAATCQR